VLDDLRARALYSRPHGRKGVQLWDEISNAPMSTEFACSRFLVPHLARTGWALFMDCDVLVRRNLDALFKLCDPSKAVMVVKHNHQPTEAWKMDGQYQTRYARKNWSSVCLWNVDHPANKAVTPELVNSAAGRDLHAFSWLPDNLIGELPSEWNWLAGVSSPDIDPAIVHFTNGIPTVPGYENCDYAQEWRDELNRWAA
jgi:lipopolysaccharide biosynthesis glycosyltransferase